MLKKWNTLLCGEECRRCLARGPCLWQQFAHVALFLKAWYPSSPHFLDRTLVIRAVSCIRVLDKQRAELAKTFPAVAVTFSVLRVWLLWALSFLGVFSSSRDSASVLVESELISESSRSHSRLETTGWNLIGINVKSCRWVKKKKQPNFTGAGWGSFIWMVSKKVTLECTRQSVLCARSWPSLKESDSGSLNEDCVHKEKDDVIVNNS